MTNGNQSPGRDGTRNEEQWQPFQRMARHAIVGSVVGAVLGSIFLRFFLPFDTWFCAVMGAVLGVIFEVPRGLSADARRFYRIQAFRESEHYATPRPGARPAPGLDEKLRKVLASSLAVGNTAQVEVNGTSLAVADVSRDGPGDSGAVHDTVAYYEPDGLRLPAFGLHPKGRAMDLVPRVAGTVDIDFPSQPVFSSAYLLSAVIEEDARSIFNDHVLAELGGRPGFHVESAGEGLAVFMPDRLLAGTELKGFLDTAARIVRLLEDSARAAGFTKARATPKRDAKALFGKIPGAAGVEARKTLVTRADAEAFARQPPPRRVPKNIALYAERFSPLMLGGMGVAFALAGTWLVLLFVNEALFTAIGFWNTYLFGGVFGLFFVAAGYPMAFYFGRRRFRIRRVLRNGRMASARIEKVEKTDESVNHVEIGLLTVVYRHEGRDLRASCKIVGPGKQRAETLAAGRRSASILHDPAVPQRILFVDDLISVGTDLEP